MSMCDQMVSQPLDLRSALFQNLKSAPISGNSMLEDFNVRQSIQKPDNFSIVRRRRKFVSMAVEQFLCLDASDAQRNLIDEWQRIRGSNLRPAASVVADFNLANR